MDTLETKHYSYPRDELEKILDEGFIRMFEVEDKLYGLTFRFSESKLYESENGLSWNYLGILDNSFRLLNYSTIDGKTIAYYYSQIFQIERSDSGFDIKELSVEGLFGHRITSITEFKGIVYVTTLSGVFYKDLEDFWIEKEEVAEE